MPPLADDRIAERLAALPGWERSGDEIVRTFELPSFPEAIAFVTRIAERALSTHDAGGITDKDFDLAAEIAAAVTPDAG